MLEYIPKNFSSLDPLSAFATVANLGTNIAGTVIAAKGQKAVNEQTKLDNERNYQFQQDQFQYQKYLNNNQIQIQAALCVKIDVA